MNLVHDLYNNTGNVNIVNVRNGATLDFLEPDDVVEVACAIDRDGAHPLPLRKIDNTHIKTMMETVKEYERQTVNAGLAGDRTAALRAMVVHPLMGDYTTSQKCLDWYGFYCSRFCPCWECSSRLRTFTFQEADSSTAS